MYDFLPYELQQYAINNKGKLFELRLRKGCYACCSLNGIYSQIIIRDQKILITDKIIENIVLSACNNSIYSFNDTIKKGYITAENGVRIGIGGTVVSENNKILTIKNFTSLCIRFPNEIDGCGNDAFKMIYSDGYIKSTVIISPPGVGKTTILRDIAKLMSKNLFVNILIVDEKNELVISDFKPFYTIDVIRNSSKKFGLYSGIKLFNPDVIIVDELTSEEDVQGVIFAVNSGVKVICSIHGDSLNHLKEKEFFLPALKNNTFENFIFLKRENGKVNAYKVEIENV